VTDQVFIDDEWIMLTDVTISLLTSVVGYITAALLGHERRTLRCRTKNAFNNSLQS
jgi:hypothetical protein